MWMPLNEPVVHTLYGHALGVHAPGLALGFEAFQAAHHQLLGHGLAVEALRATGCTNIGIASNHAPVRAASDSPEDVMAADIYDHVVNWMFADPVLVGKYPADEFAQLLSGPVDEDLKIIGAPLDWYGINYYEPTMIAAPVEGQGTEGVLEVDLPPGLPFAPVAITGYPTTDFGWPIVPEGLGEILRTFHARFGDALPADLHHRKRMFIPRRPGCRRRRRRRSTNRLPRCAPSRPPIGNGRRCRRPRLFCVVTSRQLRMGCGIQGAFRPGARRFRHPEAHTEGLVRVVSRPDRRAQSGSGLTCAEAVWVAFSNRAA